jgi:hypothetical protein
VVSIMDMVPNIDYDSGLAQGEDDRRSIEQALAELRYFRGHDQGDPSAAAMRQHIAPAISRAKASRGNAEEALVRALKMALTIKAKAGLVPVTGQGGIGSFESGSFEGLAFSEREILPESPQERAERLMSQAERYEAFNRVGLLQWALEQDGWSETDAKAIAEAVRANGTRTGIAGLVNRGGGA